MKGTQGAVGKVVLAYSGGLDTSAILLWLKERYGCEVATFTADIGQGEEVAVARSKAEGLGVREIFVEDLRATFVRDYVFPMLRANAVYEGGYLLGTSIARPLIARRLVEIAERIGADAIAHGATGKGNDQLRFELGAAALQPDLRVIAPWREWDLKSRVEVLDYCASRGIPVEGQRSGASPYSMDANLLHISYEGGDLEDPQREPEEEMWRVTCSPESAPDRPERVEIAFERGDPVAVNGAPLAPELLLAELNGIGARHGVGRLDIVENRTIGMKSRGCYETPGGTLLLLARRAVESLALDGAAARLKDELMPRYAELVYNGFWFSPEREMLQQAVDATRDRVNGTARLLLYRGSSRVIGRSSPDSLYDRASATFEDDDDAFDQVDAEGFIRLNSLRLRALARRNLASRSTAPQPAHGPREQEAESLEKKK